jgi:hypothetical protein
MKQVWGMQNSKHAKELHTIIWQVNLMDKDKLENPDVHGKTLMNWV